MSTLRLTLCAAFLAQVLAGERRALLVGVSTYRAIDGLQGPVHDVDALAAALRKNYGFDHVQCLVNAQATRQAIIAAITNLTRNAKREDYVFLYFSGHGTSGADEEALRLGLNLDLDTGALVPYDVVTSPVSELLSTLIVGKRDLRPLFKSLDDTGAEVWVVFDSCFSERTVRSLPVIGSASRYQPLLKGAQIPNDLKTGRDLSLDEAYPYRNIVYTSAAAHAEFALDISEESMRKRKEYQTVDGKPHGAFTNALLEGISGLADGNHDGVITYDELHAYTVQRVKPTFGHTPKLFPSDPGAQIRGHPIFGVRDVSRVKSRRAVHPLRLLIDADVEQRLVERVSSISQLRILRPDPTKSGDYDLWLRRDASNLRLIHTNGTILRELVASDITLLVQQLRRHVALQPLLSFGPHSEFNTWISVDPPNRGVLFGGDRLSLTIKSDRSVFPLVLSVDTHANVFVLYPTKEKHSAIPAGTVIRLPELGKIQAPFGLEQLLVCAFVEEPKGYARLAGASMSPLDQSFLAILNLVRQRCRSQMVLTLTTAPRE